MAGETRSLYSHEKTHTGENQNRIRIDDRFVYSHSGKAYPRTPHRDRNHFQERRLPFVKKAKAKGFEYYYFFAPDAVNLGRLPNPDEPHFDHAYLEKLAELEGTTIPPYRHHVPSFVYFIGCDHAVKVGIAKSPDKRLGEIQTSCPFPLRILAIVEGSRATEMEYHRRFAEHRLHGEWFAPHPDILAEIARLGAPA